MRGQGYIKSKDDVENTVIKTASNGIPILIKNVASVSFGGDIRRGALEKDGEGQAAGGIVVMRTGENAQKLLTALKKKLKKFLPVFLPELKL